MTILLVLLGALILGSLEIAPTFHRDCLAPSRTRYWKGVCVVLILLSHFTGYISPGEADEGYLMFRQWTGQSIAMLFFFYSGFGMMRSAVQKSRTYLTSLPGRFLRVWLTCAVSVAVMLLVQTARGREYSLYSIAMAFLCWASVGNSTWYIFVILTEYVLFAISILPLCLRPCRATRLLAPALLTALTVGFIVWMQGMYLEEYWYDTVLLFPLGAWWAVLSRRAERFLLRSALPWSCALLAALTAAGFAFLHREEGFLLHEGWMIASAAAVVLLSMKATPASPFLGFCGDHVLPFYLFQRVPMILLYESGLLDSAPHLGLILALLGTGVIALTYDRITGLKLRLPWGSAGKK